MDWESRFADVVLRATWPEYSIRAGEWLSLYQERGATFSKDELDRIDELKCSDEPPEDEWAKR